MIFRRGEPIALAVVPRFLSQHFAFRADEVAGKISDGAMKSFMRQTQPEGNSGVFDDAIPAIHAGLNFVDIVVAKAFVERGQRWNFALDDFVADDFENRIDLVGQHVIIFDFGLIVASLEPVV